MTLECEHGQLARSCNICEYEREKAELKENAQLIEEAKEVMHQKILMLEDDLARAWRERDAAKKEVVLLAIKLGHTEEEKYKLRDDLEAAIENGDKIMAELKIAVEKCVEISGERDEAREYITPLEGECQIGKDPWPDQCCCICKYLLVDYWHCRRMPGEIKEKGHCGCEKIRGYICIAGEIHGSKSGNSGWPHHSKGCECFTRRDAALAGKEREDDTKQK